MKLQKTSWMLTYLWGIAVGICMEDASEGEDMMEAEEKAARWQVGDGRVHILPSSPSLLHRTWREFYRMKPSGSSNQSEELISGHCQ